MPLNTGLPGDPVRTYSQSGGDGKGQLVAGAQPKDLYALVLRTAIVAADFTTGPYDPTAVSPVAVADAAYLWVGGSCGTAGGLISFVPVYYESGGSVLGVGDLLQLHASTAYRISGRYLAVGPPVLLDVLAAAQVGLVVVAVAGSWTLAAKPF